MNDYTIVKKYFKNIQKAFPIYQKKEKIYMKNFKQCVYDYIDNCDNIEINEIINEFGTPADIISEYLSNIDNDYLINNIRRSQYIKRIIVFSVFIVVVAICYRSYRLEQAIKKAEEAIVTTIDEEIIEE